MIALPQRSAFFIKLKFHNEETCQPVFQPVDGRLESPGKAVVIPTNAVRGNLPESCLSLKNILKNEYRFMSNDLQTSKI